MVGVSAESPRRRTNGSGAGDPSRVPAVARDSRSPQQTRGRTAEKPEEIPARGWWDIAWRVCKRLGSDNVTLVAGGLAMYALLSVFPGLAAMVSIYGLFATPADVINHMSAFAGVLPPGVWDIFNTQLQSITRHATSTLTTAAIVGLLIALWSARSAMSSLMTATNIAYGEREKRGFFTQILLSLAFTLGAIVGFLAMLMLGVAIPLALNVFGAAPWVKIGVDVLRFVLLWLMAALGLAVGLSLRSGARAGALALGELGIGHRGDSVDRRDRPVRSLCAGFRLRQDLWGPGRSGRAVDVVLHLQRGRHQRRGDQRGNGTADSQRYDGASVMRRSASAAPTRRTPSDRARAPASSRRTSLHQPRA